MNLEVNQEALAELKSKLTLKNATKVIFGTLISLGAAAAVLMALRNPLKASKGILRLLMIAGVIILADKAGDIAEDHFKEKIDDFAEIISDIKTEMNDVEGDTNNGTNSYAGRNSQQQPSEQRASGKEAREAARPPIRRRWWSQKERAEQVLEVDAQNVPER